MLEVGCSDGANLLPMAAALPHAQFVGCDLSGIAIAEARRAAQELGLANVTFLQRDLATLTDDPGTFDYIIAHGVYSWVPAPVRDALLALAARRLSRNGALFVSYNVYPGCHIREATWQILHYHVDRIADPRGQLDAARALRRCSPNPASRRPRPTRCCARSSASSPRKRTARCFTTICRSPTIPFISTSSPRISRGTASRISGKPRRI